MREPRQLLGGPPIPSAENVHECGQQHHADKGGVHQHCDGESEAEHAHEGHVRCDQRGERDGHHQSGGSDHPSRSGQTERNALVVVGVRLAGLSQYSRIRDTRNTS